MAQVPAKPMKLHIKAGLLPVPVEKKTFDSVALIRRTAIKSRVRICVARPQ
jgi:hypothetical protein